MVILWIYILWSYLTFFMTSNKMFLRYLAHLTSMSHMLILGLSLDVPLCGPSGYLMNTRLHRQTWSEKGAKVVPDYRTPWECQKNFAPRSKLQYCTSMWDRLPLPLFSYNEVPLGMVSISPGMLDCYGCHNKVPQTRWLTQWKFMVSQFWRLEVQDQGIGRVDSSKNSEERICSRPLP